MDYVGGCWSGRSDRAGIGKDRRRTPWGEWRGRRGHLRGARGGARRRWANSSPGEGNSPRSCRETISPRPSIVPPFPSRLFCSLRSIDRGAISEEALEILQNPSSAPLDSPVADRREQIWKGEREREKEKDRGKGKFGNSNPRSSVHLRSRDDDSVRGDPL